MGGIGTGGKFQTPAMIRTLLLLIVGRGIYPPPLKLGTGENFSDPRHNRVKISPKNQINVFADLWFTEKTKRLDSITLRQKLQEDDITFKMC